VQGAGAVWDIWQRQDLDTLRTFLREHQHLFPSPGTPSGHVELLPGQDPVRSQEFMLHDSHRELLLRLEGVQGWHFEQYNGEGIFIPSGCAHQVRT
jgi:[histone H3]-dimethyl-L-lysine9 demethylase